MYMRWTVKPDNFKYQHVERWDANEVQTQRIRYDR